MHLVRFDRDIAGIAVGRAGGRDRRAVIETHLLRLDLDTPSRTCIRASSENFRVVEADGAFRRDLYCPPVAGSISLGVNLCSVTQTHVLPCDHNAAALSAS